MTSPFRLLAAVAAIALLTTARAEDAASAPEQHVDVTGDKAPIEFPYARAYDAARKVDAASGGLAELVFLVKEKSIAATPLHVAIEYGETVERVPLDPSGSFVLPPDADAIAGNAVLTANRGRHDVGVEVGIRPHVDAAGVATMADVHRLVAAGRAARKALLPWYARLVSPAIRGMHACSLEAAPHFALRDAAGLETPLPARADDDVYGRLAQCVELATSDDDEVDPSARFVLPADATFDYLAAAF